MLEAIWQPATQQRLFRELLEAFARPAVAHDLSGWLAGATPLRAVLATLVDGATTLADPDGLVAAGDWPLLQACAEAPALARFVVASGRCAPAFEPCLGTLESPERGATLVLQVERLGRGNQVLHLTGPGIKGARHLSLAGLHEAWLARREQWTATFPLGVDIIFCDTQAVAALPRTTRIEKVERR